MRCISNPIMTKKLEQSSLYICSSSRVKSLQTPMRKRSSPMVTLINASPTPTTTRSNVICTKLLNANTYRVVVFTSQTQLVTYKSVKNGIVIVIENDIH